MSSTPPPAPSLDTFLELLDSFKNDMNYKPNFLLNCMKNENTFEELIHHLSYIRHNIKTSHLSVKSFIQLFNLLSELQFSIVDSNSINFIIYCCHICAEEIKKGSNMQYITFC